MPRTAAVADSTEPAATIATLGRPRNGALLWAGIGGGVLLGAFGWLVVWLASPAGEPTIAQAPAQVSATEASSVQAPSPATDTVNTPPSPAGDATPVDARPAPATPAPAIPADEAAPEAEVPAAEPDPAASTAEAPPVAEVAPAAAASPAEEPPLARADGPELKLEPVGSQPAQQPSATSGELASSPGESAAASDDVRDNEESAPGAANEAPAAIEVSAGDPAPLTAAEIQHRLEAPLARVDFTAVPLGHLAGFLGDVSGARVVLDEPSLAQRGKSRKTPITVKLTAGTALAILEAAAEQAELDYRIEPGRITLSARGP